MLLHLDKEKPTESSHTQSPVQLGHMRMLISYAQKSPGHYPWRSQHNRSTAREEPVEFEKWPVGVRDLRRITDYFRGIYIRIYLKWMKQTQKMSTCNQLPVRGDFWASSSEILVFASATGYTLISSGFPSLNWGIFFYKFLWNDP